MKKVLVAEDEESIREFIVINLTRSGYNVEQAENGAVALEKFSQDETGFDVAILDIMMPELDGLSVCKEACRLFDYDDAVVLDVAAERLNRCTVALDDQAVGLHALAFEVLGYGLGTLLGELLVVGCATRLLVGVTRNGEGLVGRACVDLIGYEIEQDLVTLRQCGAVDLEECGTCSVDEDLLLALRILQCLVGFFQFGYTVFGSLCLVYRRDTNLPFESYCFRKFFSISADCR